MGNTERRHGARKKTSRDNKLLEGGECSARLAERQLGEQADEGGESARLAEQGGERMMGDTERRDDARKRWE